MIRGPKVQVVLHRDENGAADDLTMFARIMSTRNLHCWTFIVEDIDTKTDPETATITIQFIDKPRRLNASGRV